MLIDGVHIDHNLEEILGELKQQLHAQGISLLNKTTATPTDVMVQCPYHKGGQERKPSAGIRKSDGLFHCMACQETHSLTEVIAHCFGYTDPMVGWRWLQKYFISVGQEQRKPLDLNLERNVPKFRAEYVQEDVLDKFRYLHPYMYKRGLNDPIIELFDIGYDRDTECITFPVRDIHGNTLFVARRSVKTKYFNYPSGAEKPLYGIYELSKNPSKEVIVCESMLDALVCWVWGRPAVAMNGLGTDLQFKQLSQLNCRKLILATDNDTSGRNARARIKSKVRGKLITEFDYATYPVGKKDMNDLTEDEFRNLREIF